MVSLDQYSNNNNNCHNGLVELSYIGTEQISSSIPGSVRYISHAHRVYDYSSPSRFYRFIWLDTKIVLKKIGKQMSRALVFL